VSKIYFVAGISTDIGKTFLVENVCRILRQKQIAVKAIKPVVSGFSIQDKNSDSAKILLALGLELSQNNLDSISPWRFSEACSPHQAAKNIAQEINFLELKNFCEQKISEAKNAQQFLLIEAAGGLMTPINDEKTFLDLAADLQIPVLLVSANYLGAISHTLCAVEALKGKKILLEKIIINDDLPLENQESLIKASQIIQTLKNFTKTEVISLKVFLESF
jgi:dethiobiotin synthetase